MKTAGRPSSPRQATDRATAVVVTRPYPDNEKTAEALRQRGFEALLAPALRFDVIPFSFEDDRYDAVLVTSANAIRALSVHSRKAAFMKLSLFTVGDATAEAARQAGFEQIISAKGDAAALRDLVVQRVQNGSLKPGAKLCYIAAADQAHDLESELSAAGFDVTVYVAYRMVPVVHLPDDVVDAFRNGDAKVVMHFSVRSTRSFLEASRMAGIEVAALALPQCCISHAVAAVVREAGAERVPVAQTPDQNALLATVEQALNPVPRS